MAHHNTIFSQVLKLIPRHIFDSLSRQHDGQRRSDALPRWSQFIALPCSAVLCRALPCSAVVCRGLPGRTKLRSSGSDQANILIT